MDLDQWLTEWKKKNDMTLYTQYVWHKHGDRKEHPGRIRLKQILNTGNKVSYTLTDMKGIVVPIHRIPVFQKSYIKIYYKQAGQLYIIKINMSKC